MRKGTAMRRARATLRTVILLLLPALVASCDDDTTGPVNEGNELPEAGPLLTVSGDMGAQFQDLTVTREGVAVTDAIVTVNGVTIPHTGAGRYQGQLPTGVPVGTALDLRVSAGGATAQGTASVPEAPDLTAPATGDDFAPGGSIYVNWTSAINPDRFVVSAAWVLDDVASSKTFPAAAGDRGLTIAASEFPAGTDITISVSACDDGSFTGQADLDSHMSLCAESPVGVISATTDAAPLLIHGGVGVQHENIWIFQGGRGITDGVSEAVVTVNGVAIPNVGGRLYPGYYSGELPAAVPPGASLDLRVSARGLVVEATNTVPAMPVLSAPYTGTIFAPTDSITVRWTSATNPDRFAVYVNSNKPDWHRDLPGAARELTIPASVLPAGVDLMIGVVAYNDGSFSGPAHPDSRMGTMVVSNLRAVITVQR